MGKTYSSFSKSRISRSRERRERAKTPARESTSSSSSCLETLYPTDKETEIILWFASARSGQRAFPLDAESFIPCSWINVSWRGWCGQSLDSKSIIFRATLSSGPARLKADGLTHALSSQAEKSQSWRMFTCNIDFLKLDYAFVLGILYCYISLQTWFEVSIYIGLSFPRRASCRVTGLLWFVIHSLPYARFSISDDPIDPIPSFFLPKSDYQSVRRGIQLEFPERAG